MMKPAKPTAEVRFHARYPLPSRDARYASRSSFQWTYPPCSRQHSARDPPISRNRSARGTSLMSARIALPVWMNWYAATSENSMADTCLGTPGGWYSRFRVILLPNSPTTYPARR